MHPPRSITSDTVKEVAAYWFARSHGAGMDDAERAAFERWRSADAAHAREYDLLEWIWQASQAIPDEEVRDMLRQAQAAEASQAASAPVPAPIAARPAGSARGRVRRRWALGSSVAAAACALFGAYLYVAMPWGGGAPAFAEVYATTTGEIRSEALPDGSQLTLNAQTRLEVQLGADERRVTLHEGDVLFDVARMPSRPFVIDAGDVRVRVTGTVFAVRKRQDAVTVAVRSGTVEVASLAGGQQPAVAVEAGQLLAAEQGRLQASPSTDVEDAMAWTAGRLVFRNARLDVVLRDLNPHLRHPILLAGEELGSHRVSGVFHLHQLDDVTEVLTRTLPVQAQRLASGDVELRRR